MPAEMDIGTPQRLNQFRASRFGEMKIVRKQESGTKKMGSVATQQVWFVKLYN